MKNSQIKELIEVHFPTFRKLARLSYRQITFALVTLGIVLSMPGNATAWTWVLHHNGHSPTPTGPNINGGGRLIQRQNYNPGSNSQRWSFVENGNGRHMLMNLATKKCMNVYLAKPQSRPNDYLCNRDDKEQQFRVRKLKDVPHSQPAMDVMIQVADIYHNGKGLCLDDANGHFQLHYCNQNNTNMVFRMDRVSTFIASDIVNQGTQASRSSGSSGGSNGNQGNTLPRTGGTGNIVIDGLLFITRNGKLVIDGGLYTVQQYHQMRNTINKFINYPKNQRYERRNDSRGQWFQYLADWGYYEKLTGYYAQEHADNISVWGSFGTGVLGTLGGFLGGGAGFLVAGPPGAGYGAAAGASLTGGGSYALVDQHVKAVERCIDYTGHAYINYRLLSGSWKNSLRQLPTKGAKAFAMYPTVSCD